MTSPSEIGANALQKMMMHFHFTDGRILVANVYEPTAMRVMLEISKGVGFISLDKSEATSAPTSKVMINTSNVTYIEV